MFFASKNMGFELAFELKKFYKWYILDSFWLVWKWHTYFGYLWLSLDWPGQITWDLKCRLFMLFPTYVSNRKPICNVNLKIFKKKPHFAVFYIDCQFGVVISSRKQITWSENYALSDGHFQSHFCLDILEKNHK